MEKSWNNSIEDNLKYGRFLVMSICEDFEAIKQPSCFEKLEIWVGGIKNMENFSYKHKAYIIALAKSNLVYYYGLVTSKTLAK